MRNSLIYLGKQVAFNYNEQIAFHNMIKNDDEYEIRKSLDDHKSSSLSLKFENYLLRSKMGEFIELVNILFTLFFLYNFFYISYLDDPEIISMLNNVNMWK
jgi:hypothetical protein